MHFVSMNLIFIIFINFLLNKFVAAVPIWYNGTDGRAYLLEIKPEKNWFNAWNECARRDLQLLTIESQSKNDVIFDLLTKVVGSPIDLWLAGHDELAAGKQERPFYWLSTGQQFAHQNWHGTNPNNENNVENCVHIFKTSKSYQWNDKICTSAYGYICEETRFPAKFQQNLMEKNSEIYAKNENLKTSYANKPQLIEAINTKTDFEIERLTFNIKYDIQQLETDINQKIKQLNEQRRRKIQQLVDEFSEKMLQIQKDVEELLRW